MKLLEICVPQYSVATEPDYKTIGVVLDQELKRHFMGKSVLVRGIASSEHPDKSIDELVDIIKKTGTDRYDQSRAGDRYNNVENKHIDLFAFPAEVTPSAEIFHQMIYGFYHSAIGIHGRPMRIDIVIIYDANQMEQVLHQYEGRDDIKDDGFVFNNPNRKAAAVLGIIKIL